MLSGGGQLNTRTLNGDTGTQITKSGTQTNAGSTILHTVTAGKSFYLTAANLFGVNGASVWGYIQVTDAADATQYNILYCYDRFGYSHDFIYPVKIPAGYKVKIVIDAATGEARGFIHGYEI